jgi:hypothetical protein
MNTSLLTTRGLPAALLCLSACAPALAVEAGAPITPFGVLDFGAGILPPPTPNLAVGLRVANYRATRLRDDAGNPSPVGASLRVTSVGLALLKMTTQPLWGGTYGFGAVLPVLDMDLDLSVPTPGGPLPLSGKAGAQGDAQVIPLMVQWSSPGWFATGSLTVQLPTGSYDKARLVNPGSNHWTLIPAMSFTHITSTGLELSSNIQLNLNGRNKATDYRSGTEYQHEFAIGQHVGPYTVGIGGYLYRQISDDHGPGVAAGGNRSRVTALGPAITYFNPGAGLPPLGLHIYREFDARNRTAGTQVAVRASMAF